MDKVEGGSEVSRGLKVRDRKSGNISHLERGGWHPAVRQLATEARIHRAEWPLGKQWSPRTKSSGSSLMPRSEPSS